MDVVMNSRVSISLLQDNISYIEMTILCLINTLSQ